MRNLLLYISILSFVGCNLFQKQQPAGESVASFWKDEVFVPVEKELYVIKDVTTRYASLTDSIPSLFCIMGDKLEIIAEGKELYKTKRGYVEKEDMGDWEALKS